MYNDIEKSHGLLMDGGIPDAYNNVLWTPGLINAARASIALQIAYAQIQYRGSGTPEVGIGGRLDRNYWRAYTLTGAGVLADDTVDAQSSTTNDFPLEVAADANSGWMVAATHLFNAIDLLISTASTGTNPTRTLEYSGPAGWVAISNALVPPVTGAHYLTGENLILWSMPQDWTALTEALHGTGVPEGWYGIRSRSTTVPGTVQALAKSMSVARVKSLKDITATAGIYTWNPAMGPLHIDAPCDALVGVCSVAHDATQFSALVKQRG